MTKPTAGFQTPRPSSSLRIPSTATAGARSSAAKLAVASAVPRDLASSTKVVRKCLDYDGDSILPAGGVSTSPLDDMLQDDLAPLLDLPDPEVSGDSSSSSSIIFAAPEDAVITSADSSATEVAAPADCTADSDAPLPVLEQMNLVMSELHAAAGLSPRSKRILTALAEAANAELTPTATARRLRRATFWGKVRVAVLAATVTTVAAIDVALAAYLYARRVSDRYHVMPPT